MKFILYEVFYQGSAGDVESRVKALVESIRALFPDFDPDQVRHVQPPQPGRHGVLLCAEEDCAEEAASRVRRLLESRRLAFQEHHLDPVAMMEGAPGQAGRGSTDAVARRLIGGQVFCRLGLFEDAGRQFRQALELDPESAEACFGLALSHRRSGHWDEAARALRRAVDLDPDNAAYRYALGELEHARGELERAIDHYKEGLHRDPHETLCYDGLGWACLETGDSRRARVAFEEALQRDPTLSSSLCGLAFTEFDAGRLERAVELFQRTLREDPGFGVARLQLGWCWIFLGHLERAEVEFLQVAGGRAPELQPAAWFSLGNLYLQRGALDLAVEYLHKAAQGGWIPALWLLAEACVQSRRLEEALQAYRQILALQPDLAREVQPRLALCCLRLERFDEAEEHLRKARGLLGPDLELKQMECALHGGRGEWEEALAAAQEAWSLDPESPVVAFEQGWALENLGHLDEAAGWYRRALRLDPRCAPALGGLGWIFLRQGRAREAVVVFERALEVAPQDSDLRYGLGRALLARRDYPAAARVLARAHEESPGEPHYRIYLALCLYHLGRLERVAQLCQSALAQQLDAETAALAHHLQGLLLMDQGCLAGARREFQRALCLDARRSETCYHLGVCLWKQGDKARASRLWARFRSLRSGGRRAG